MRSDVALSDHAGWEPAADRPDPVALLEAQDATREPDLVPVRHGRMMVSPFTFYRGAAKIMAADLKDTPTSRPERPALRRRSPLELRRVRLARADAAVRPERLRRDAARAVRVRREAHGRELHDRGPEQRVHGGRHAGGHARLGAAYREAMAGFAQMGTMDVWYAHLSEQELMAAIKTCAASRGAAKARRRKRRRASEGRQEDRREGTHARQPAGAVEARRSASTAAIGSSASHRS